MTINLENIQNHIIEMKDFELKWRFTEEKYDVLPELHLNQIKPLSKGACNFLDQYIKSTVLQDNEPFKKNLFHTVEYIYVSEANERDVKEWLYQRGVAFDKNVYVSWDSEKGAIVPWKILIDYFDSFYYPGSDDLIAIDENLNWALLFAHWETIFFGTKMTVSSKNI